MKMEIRFAFARQDVIILVLPFPFWQQIGGDTDDSNFNQPNRLIPVYADPEKVNRPVQKFNYSSKSNATNSQLRMPAAAYSSLVISRK